MARVAVPGPTIALASRARARAMRGTTLHLVHPSARYLPRRVVALRDDFVDALGGTRGGTRRRTS